MPSRATRIIRTLYADDLEPRRKAGILGWFGRRSSNLERISNRRRREIIDLYREREQILNKKRLAVGIFLLLLFGFAYISIVYFNRLTQAEQDVFKESAKIDSLLQRRRNISINLARTLKDYAVHEQGIFSHVSDMRSSSKKDSAEQEENGTGSERDDEKSSSPQTDLPSSKDARVKDPPKGPLDKIISILDGTSGGKMSMDNKLARLMAVAENYPDLKLSENFRRFMDALIETEKEISNKRMEYSEIVNNYTTQLRTFPGMTFAVIYGFKPVPYFRADGEAMRFQPVAY